jgi:Bacterial Ig domain/RTX calcium-binding nonapeptide repeat (4 copies)
MMKEEIVRRRKQERLSRRSSPLSTVALAVVFAGLLSMMMIMPSGPVLVFVFAENIDGTPGDDTLNGTPEADTINGFEGNDIILGEGGDDTLDGSKGDDEIRGGDGNDGIKDGNADDYHTSRIDGGNKMYGGSGNDNIDVGIDHLRSDYYYVYGEDGADYIKVVSNAHIEGGLENDIIYCTGFECGVSGDEGDDEVHIETHDIPDLANANGGSGNDKLYIVSGGGGLVGGDGNDYLFVEVAGGLDGGEGDDILEAQQGETDYRGGNGADTFKCSPGQADKVQDYSPEEGDQIVSEADCEQITTVSASNPNNLYASFINVVGGQTLSGIYEVHANASPQSMVSNVKLYVDDSTLVKQENNAPYEFPLDTTKFSNGNHVLKAIATYNTGETATTTVTVKFENQAPAPTPTPPPSSTLTISFANVNEGQTLSGKYNVVVTASDTSKVSNIKLYVDSTLVKQENSAPYEFPTDTTKFADGTHTLKAVATDKSGNTITKTVTVTFKNQASSPPPPTSPPPPSSSLTISFANVNEEQTLSGIYEVVVTASDTTKVSNIKLYVDSTTIKTEYNAPYEFGTDTTKFSDGNHVLKAVATDKTGNTITETVTVIFKNQAAEEAEPSTNTIQEEELPADGEEAEPSTNDTGGQ